MATFDRYILSQIFPSLGMTLVVALLILLVERLLRVLDLVLGNSGPLHYVARMLAYLAPHYLGIALPFAFFLAILAAGTFSAGPFALLVLAFAARTFATGAFALTEHVANLQTGHRKRALSRVRRIHGTRDCKRASESRTYSQRNGFNQLLLSHLLLSYQG